MELFMLSFPCCAVVHSLKQKITRKSWEVCAYPDWMMVSAGAKHWRIRTTELKIFVTG